MKTLKTILLLTCLGFISHGHTQILKKLGHTVKNAAEKTLEKKVEQKTEKETEKAFDSTFNKQKSIDKSEKTIPNDDPAANYNFSHKYVMQVKSDKNTATLNYYLTNSGEYIGSTVPDKNGKEDVITVMDLDRTTMFMFMDKNGDKSQMAMKLNLEEVTNDAMTETDIEITPTENTKNILGYTCKEFKVSGKDLNGLVWVAPNAEISFSKSFYSIKAKKGIDQSWMKLLNGLTMEMDMVDTSKRKPQNIKMSCIALEKIKLNIQTNKYKKLM
ncbi:DUF4412 domain-containing protein [Winogradskyella forsetii]|uniref:DUF4412 domain-containing protein n=1 Tax=Winogradskyella forsetii TaxID=2686077 RepID=UPI0015BBB93F|nr:DUF4412 domain-containing protein [Winogradskyella forsetii]